MIEEDRDGNRNQVTLEVWSARPSQRVGSVSVQSQSGHLYTAINDDGSVVAITDHAQPGTAVKSTVRLWSRTRRADLLGLEGEEFVGFSPDHRHFATTKGFWRLPDDDRAAPIQTTSWNEPYSLAFSRDGAYVGTRKPYDGAVRVWDVRAAQWLPSLRAPEGELLAISEAARVIILNGAEGAVVWDTRKETIRSNVPRVAGKDQYAITREVKAAAFALPDPRSLVVEYDRRSLATQRVLSLPMWGSALATTELGAHETVEWLGVRVNRSIS